MKIILILVLLAACGDNLYPAPDAAQDATTCSLTWKDVYAIWEDARCSFTERCYPEAFRATYKNHPTCLVRQARFHCTMGAEEWCTWRYPVDRCAVLQQCYDEMSVLSCIADDVPPSCYLAIVPGRLGD